MRLLLVEDDPMIGESVRLGLRQDGFSVDWVHDGRAVDPALILTARDAVADRVEGLDTGAGDYLVKPFDLDELAVRIRALLRGRSGRAEPVLEHALG